MTFIGREYELEIIDDHYGRKDSSFLIVYGRRRVGKTRLLTHWMESRKAPGFYWVATQTSAALLLSSFYSSVNRLITGKEPERGFSYYDWEEAFQKLASAIKDKPSKTVIILDEFTYAMDTDPSLASTLQKLWDHLLKPLPIMLVLSGSHIGMMERDLIAYRAPLYGRGTGKLHLQELMFREVASFFPKYTIEEKVAVYGILGGIPYYLEFFDPKLSISENIKKRVLRGDNLLQEEPRLLLHEQVQEPRHYVSILISLAHGHTIPAEIALDIGEDRALVNKYLTTMIHLGLVHRDIPVTVRKADSSRRGRYHIVDPYLRFYFRFIHPRLSEIASRKITSVVNGIKANLTGFIGKYAFEELCRRWVATADIAGKIPFSPEAVGSHWSAKEQIDVVGINWTSHQILFGECKWGVSEPLGVDVVQKLQKQSQPVIPTIPSGKPFEAHYAFFSRSGFTPEARQAIGQIKGVAVDMAEFEQVLNMEGTDY